MFESLGRILCPRDDHEKLQQHWWSESAHAEFGIIEKFHRKPRNVAGT